ncbi:MAG: hypothetical protein COB50_00515 [Thiotrichales bacterium]|nr:MAG: hypothetical protein COB50_00515 [Thiotrichales bacterium]
MDDNNEKNNNAIELNNANEGLGIAVSDLKRSLKDHLEDVHQKNLELQRSGNKKDVQKAIKEAQKEVYRKVDDFSKSNYDSDQNDKTKNLICVYEEQHNEVRFYFLKADEAAAWYRLDKKIKSGANSFRSISKRPKQELSYISLDADGNNVVKSSNTENRSNMVAMVKACFEEKETLTLRYVKCDPERYRGDLQALLSAKYKKISLPKFEHFKSLDKSKKEDVKKFKKMVSTYIDFSLGGLNKNGVCEYAEMHNYFSTWPAKDRVMALEAFVDAGFKNISPPKLADNFVKDLVGERKYDGANNEINDAMKKKHEKDLRDFQKVLNKYALLVDNKVIVLDEGVVMAEDQKTIFPQKDNLKAVQKKIHEKLQKFVRDRVEVRQPISLNRRLQPNNNNNNNNNNLGINLDIR